MKSLRYLLALLFAVVAASCTEPNVQPRGEGDDDDEPIIIGQPDPEEED